MRKYLLIFLLVIWSCKTDQSLSSEDIQKQLQTMQKLGTSEFTIKKVYFIKDYANYKIGRRKNVTEMKATVVAGIDFSKIKIEQIDHKKKTIVLSIPKSKIIYVNINPNDIKHIPLVSITRSDFGIDEFQKAEALGEKLIRNKIKDLKILDKSSKNAVLFLRTWLTTLGFETITINQYN